MSKTKKPGVPIDAAERDHHDPTIDDLLALLAERDVLSDELDLSSVDDDPHRLMAMAAQIEALVSLDQWAQMGVDDPTSRGHAPHARDSADHSATDNTNACGAHHNGLPYGVVSAIVAAKGDRIAQNDPVLVATRNRAYGLVRSSKPKARVLGARGWLATTLAGISIGLAGFSTVYALSPFDNAVLDDSLSPYQISESSLFGNDSLWTIGDSE